MASAQLRAHCRSTLVLSALVVAGTCTLSGCAASAQAKSPPPVNLGDNAALKYLTAFLLLDNLSPEQKDLLDGWKKLPMDKATIALINGGTSCLRVLRQAAQVRPCDWSLKKAGPGAFMPQLAAARQAALLACLDARYRVEKGEGADAVSDLLAVFALARQINCDGPTIGFLLECSLEEMATYTAAGCLPRLTRDQLNRLAAGLDSMPPRNGFREAVLGTLAEAKWFADPINERGLFTPEELSQCARGLNKVQEHFEALAEMGSLPLPEFDRQAKVLQEKMKTDCPCVSRLFFESAPLLRHRDAREQTRMAMLKAAIAVDLDGPGRLKEFKDPGGEGPFAYSKTEDGFELRSKLPVMWEGKAATLVLSSTGLDAIPNN